MLEPEARRLGEILAGIPAESLSPMLNVGSSTREFRTVGQPWIEEHLFAPLRARGVQVVHVDVRDGDGIDLRADLLTREGMQALAGVKARSALLCNVLEHVPDPADFTNRLLDVLPASGTLIVTVPNSYPFHEDPIDTLFRPGPEEVAALSAGAELMHGEIVPAGSYREEFRRDPKLALRLAPRLLFPFIRWRRWKRLVKQMYWLFNDYRVTIAVLRKLA